MNTFQLSPLPKQFSYLNNHNQKYRVIVQTASHVQIKRIKGQVVDVPIDNISRCYMALKNSTNRILPLQSIPAGAIGESVVGAILVAAGLAKVVSKKPIQLLGV